MHLVSWDWWRSTSAVDSALTSTRGWERWGGQSQRVSSSLEEKSACWNQFSPRPACSRKCRSKQNLSVETGILQLFGGVKNDLGWGRVNRYNPSERRAKTQEQRVAERNNEEKGGCTIIVNLWIDTSESHKRAYKHGMLIRLKSMI